MFRHDNSLHQDIRRRLLGGCLGLMLILTLTSLTPTATADVIDRAYAAAHRAEMRGDIETADQLYRDVLRKAPNHEASYRALLRLHDGRKLPVESEALRATLEVLPSGFRKHETRRFIVLSNTNSTWTQSQAERLEQTYHQFTRYCRRAGLRPLPLRHKLVCVLFDDRASYQHFARTHDDVTTQWIAGYYSPTNDRVVFYNVQSNPSVVEARDRLAEMEREIADVDRDVRNASRRGKQSEAEQLRSLRDQYRDHVERESSRVDAFASRVSVSTTTHEATHMLLFHTRVQTPFVQYPLWICEGLATNFETQDSNQAFGPSYDFSPRRHEFITMLEHDELLPLRELVTIGDLPGDNDDMARVLYHQSYALVHWMCRFRKAELRRYLELMCEQPEGAVHAREHIQIFEKAFGPISNLERSWLRYENQQMTVYASE